MPVTDFKPDLKSLRYSLPAVAFLLKTNVSQVERWANGYTWLASGTRRAGSKRPILVTDRDDPRLISFPELVELMIVKRLLEWDEKDADGKVIAKAPTLDTIRDIAHNLKDKLGEFPFARAELGRVGRQIVTSAVDGLFVNAADYQILLEIAEDLRRDLEFDEAGIAQEWHPLHNDLVIINPLRGFGAPIVKEGVSVEIINKRLNLGESVEEVQEWFDISPESVQAAAEFDREWRKAA